jgi:hypothetical protein
MQPDQDISREIKSLKESIQTKTSEDIYMSILNTCYKYNGYYRLRDLYWDARKADIKNTEKYRMIVAVFEVALTTRITESIHTFLEYLELEINQLR